MPSKVYDTSKVTAPAPSARPAGRRGRRLGAAAMLAIGLAAGSVGGGAAGAYATSHLLAPASARMTTIVAQTVANAAPAANVAGPVFTKVSRAVVQVVSETSGDGAGALGTGSGFVVDARGMVLTNNHVVDGAGTVRVRFADGQEQPAAVLGTDRGNDLALLKVALPANTPVAQLGDSDRAKVGEIAIAIGSPFGLDQTVTQGIISAVHRNWQPGNGRVQRNLLQTDAPINPGNSGGPLLNASGEVVGINTMIESPVRGSVGVGFAIPINTAKSLLGKLEAGAHLEPVWLGIAGREITPELAQAAKLPAQQGVLVVSVVPGSPAEMVGLQAAQAPQSSAPSGGDIITAVDGKAVKSVPELTDQLAGHTPGQKVTLTVMRNGKSTQVQVTLQAWPRQAA